MAKQTAASKKPPTKSEIFSQISDKTGLSKKEVKAVFDELTNLAGKNLKRNGAFNMPGLCKMVVKKKKGTPAGERVNPFTGEKKWYPAKPPSKTVRVRPLKGLKDMV